MNRGFTLLELMIAIGVLTAGMLGILGVLAAATHSQRAAFDDCMTSTVADTVIAEIRRECALGGSPDPVDDARYQFDTRYRYSVDMMLLDKYMGEYLVTVTVIWLQRGTERERAFRTIIVAREI